MLNSKECIKCIMILSDKVFEAHRLYGYILNYFFYSKEQLSSKNMQYMTLKFSHIPQHLLSLINIIKIIHNKHRNSNNRIY